MRRPQGESGVGTASIPSAASAARASSRVVFSRLIRRSSGGRGEQGRGQLGCQRRAEAGGEVRQQPVRQFEPHRLRHRRMLERMAGERGQRGQFRGRERGGGELAAGERARQHGKAAAGAEQRRSGDTQARRGGGIGAREPPGEPARRPQDLPGCLGDGAAVGGADVTPPTEEIIGDRVRRTRAGVDGGEQLDTGGEARGRGHVRGSQRVRGVGKRAGGRRASLRAPGLGCQSGCQWGCQWGRFAGGERVMRPTSGAREPRRSFALRSADASGSRCVGVPWKAGRGRAATPPETQTAPPGGHFQEPRTGALRAPQAAPAGVPARCRLRVRRPSSGYCCEEEEGLNASCLRAASRLCWFSRSTSGFCACAPPVIPLRPLMVR